jgi:hypothetical protein
MDSQYCQTLIEDLAIVAGDGWEVLKATKSAWRMIPNSPGLYMFVWKPSFELQMAKPPPQRVPFPWVLYVGRTGDASSKNTLKKRYREAYAKVVAGDPEALWDARQPRSRAERLRRYLSIVPLEFWYTVVSNVDAIAELERRLFNLFAPPFNVSGGPRLHPTKPEKAF